MTKVLCLDCEPEFEARLSAAGHSVVRGALGYGGVGRLLTYPPHEAEAIVSNITKPVCFDMNRWGSGADNFKFDPIHGPSDEQRAVVPTLRGAASGTPRTEPRYRLALERQLRRMYQATPFAQPDLIRAVEQAGVPILFFINRAWIRHATEFPNAVGLTWELERTLANEVRIVGELARIFPEYATSIALEVPLRYRLGRGPFTHDDRKIDLVDQTAVTNTVGDVFGSVARPGHGTIWALPGTADNLAFAKLFLARLEAVRQAGVPRWQPRIAKLIAEHSVASGRRPFVMPGSSTSPGGQASGTPATATTAPTTTSVTSGSARDAFICHASEDKDAIARPIADGLIARGVSVWFDEYELVLGQSLRERIDQGLRDSRFGVVVLSPSFFAKDWPRNELNGLVSLEMGGPQRILPVWHTVGREDVRAYSPILSDRFAALSADGLPKVIDAIERAILRLG